MDSVEMGSTWTKRGRLGTYKVDGLSSSQARLRNVKTRRTEWVRLTTLREQWTRVDAAPVANPSLLEFTLYLSGKVEGFRAHWMEERAKDEENWPTTQKSIGDWEEQFRAFMDWD